MQNGDEASPSIILAGRALLMKMLITLERQGIFGSNFVYYYIMFLTGNWCHYFALISLVNEISILPLALQRNIPQEEIYPFSQNYFQICLNGDDGSLFIVRSNLVSSQKTNLIRLPVQTNFKISQTSNVSSDRTVKVTSVSDYNTQKK